MKLEPTGERMIVDSYQSTIQDYVIYLTHIAAYRFAETHVRGKRVLDYGCGSGYGSARLADSAEHVHAVDVAHDAIKHAKQSFMRPNLTFSCVDPAAPMPFGDAVFDVVISFQVFEHVSNVAHYLGEIRRVLKPGGTLLLITPDRTTRLLPMQKPWNRWHVREYDDRSLSKCLAPFFHNVEIRHMSGRTDVIDIELRRCRKLKWVLLPFTLPFVPDALRIASLGALRAVRNGARNTPGRQTFDFDDSVITIGRGLTPSLNLVAIAGN